MKSVRLTGEYEKKYNELIEQYAKEVDERAPKRRGTFDQQPDLARKEVDKKYIPMLADLTREGMAAGEYEEIETSWRDPTEQNYP